MSKKQSDLFSQFDSSQWNKTAPNIDDILNHPIVIIDAYPTSSDFGNSEAFELVYVNPDNMETVRVRTQSKNLIRMAKDFIQSDIKALPIEISRVRQAYVAELSRQVSEETLSDILESL